MWWLGSVRGKRLEAAPPYNSGYNFLPWSFGAKIKKKKACHLPQLFCLALLAGYACEAWFFMGHVIQHVFDGINWKSSMLVAMTSCCKILQGSFFQMQTATISIIMVVVSLFYKGTRYESSYWHILCTLGQFWPSSQYKKWHKTAVHSV